MDVQAISNQGYQNVSQPETTPVRHATPIHLLNPQRRETHPLPASADSKDRLGTEQADRENREPTREEVAATTEGMNTLLQANNSHIKFAMHEKSKQMMVEVIDGETDEVIRTYPAKELLDLAAKIGEMVGALLDKKT